MAGAVQLPARRETQQWLSFCASVRLPVNATCLNLKTGRHTALNSEMSVFAVPGHECS